MERATARLDAFHPAVRYTIPQVFLVMELLGGELFYPIVQKGRFNEWEAKHVVCQARPAMKGEK